MTTIFERVTTALNTLSPAVPFALAPYASVGDLPDLYLAYQLIDSSPEEHADNAEIARSYVIQISIYNRAGLVSLPNVDLAMTSAGFQKGPFRQLKKDDLTGHHGLAKDYVFLDFNL